MTSRNVAIKAICIGLSVGLGIAAAQTPAALDAAPKPMAFDIVSIRQNTSTDFPRNGPPPFGPTPSGYHMTSMPLILPILTAYVPKAGALMFNPDQVIGLPDWAMRDRYDIEAKVADEDLPDWQKPGAQKVMLQTMLQAMLTERCKLVVHRETKDASVYLLVLGKGAPKFKETDPAAEHPEGIKLPWGGVMVPSRNGAVLYGASMASLATLLSQMGRTGRPIQDKTGLTGRYDITLVPPASAMPAGPSPGDQTGGAMASDPGSLAFSMVEQLGLKLDPSKASVETLVVDHIEKPSAN